MATIKNQYAFRVSGIPVRGALVARRRPLAAAVAIGRWRLVLMGGGIHERVALIRQLGAARELGFSVSQRPAHRS